MPERAELREFHLSEYRRSRYTLLSVFCSLSGVLSFGYFALEIAGSRHYGLASVALLLACLGCCAVLARLFWLKANRPFARLSSHGLSLQDGLVLPSPIPWTRIYAIEQIGPLKAKLRMSGMRHRTVELTMFEREERRDFVEAVRKWVYTSH